MAAQEVVGQRADVARTKAFHQPEDQTAEHRAVDVADTTEHCGCERLEPRNEAHVEVHEGVVGCQHDAGQTRQACANAEGQQHHLVGVDAEQRRYLGVLRGRAHHAADLCFLDQQGQADHADQREHQDDDLRDADDEAVELDGLLRYQRGELVVVAAEEHHDDRL